MLHEDLTINDFENELKNIIENNLLTQVDNYNIARLREEFRKVISKAKHFKTNLTSTRSRLKLLKNILGETVFIKTETTLLTKVRD